MSHRSLRMLLAMLFAVVVPSSVYARANGDRVQVGRSIVVEEDEEVGNVVCIGCSVHMMGTCGDVVTIGGSSVIEGTVKGDAVAVGGGVHVGENASISGDVVTVGGRLSRHPRATIKGEVTTQSGPIVFLALFLVPLIPVVLIVALIVWLVKPTRPRAALRA
jgi:UDP-3-O-[3-hydroxymyristoyl] glucosamine N-acyltransferase